MSQARCAQASPRGQKRLLWFSARAQRFDSAGDVAARKDPAKSRSARLSFTACHSSACTRRRLEPLLSVALWNSLTQLHPPMLLCNENRFCASSSEADSKQEFQRQEAGRLGHPSSAGVRLTF